MILSKRFVFLLVVAVATPWFLALGAAAAPANLQELLDQTKNVRAIQARASAEREREFIGQRNQQAKLLQDAQKARDAADARSQAVSAEYDRNDLRIQELESLLNARMGSLGELFGVVRQFSGDASGIVYQSLVSAQYPGRDEFFTNIAKAKELPSIVQLEQLWYEMLREITASGEVARFNAPVVSTDGARTVTPVVRVGPFIAMMEGQYLTYKPDVKVLSVLPRQPPGWLLERAKEVTSATSGYVSSAIDPSRGVLLSLYVERPNWVERVQHGEMVNYVILFVGFAGAVCGIFQFFYLLRVRFAVSRQLRSLDKPKADNPLGRVLATFRGDASTAEEEAEVIELRISEAVLREVPLLERFQPFLRLAVAAGPLLGLVGTVVGMIITFQSITESGQSDPRLMAHGIGTAMIATVLGLGIAIPLLFVNALLASMSRGVVQTLDEQSTGLLAEMLEREQAAGGKGGGPRHA